MTARALFAGVGAARALAAPRTGVVELAFTRSAYLRLGADWVLLAEPHAPFGPLSVAVTGLRWADVTVGMPVHVGTEQLEVAAAAVGLRRMRRRTSIAAESTGTCAGRASATAAAALAALPAPPSALQPGLDALAAGRIHDGVRALAGLGEGLTPAGDDVLAGAAAVLSRCDRLHAADMSTLAAGRAAPLGLAYLRCAERGELPDAGAQLLSAIYAGSPGSLEASLPAVRAWGASSGTALAWGICAGVIAAGGPPNSRRR